MGFYRPFAKTTPIHFMIVGVMGLLVVDRYPVFGWLCMAPAIWILFWSGVAAIAKAFTKPPPQAPRATKKRGEVEQTIDSKSEVIASAIKGGGKIEFLYAAKGQNTISRTIKPTRMDLLDPEKTNSLCVVGHCDLKNAERTFSVNRMESVKAV